MDAAMAFLGDGPGHYQQPAMPQPQQQSPYQGGLPTTNNQSPYGNAQIQVGGIAPHFVQHGQLQPNQQQPQQFQQAPQQFQPPTGQFQPQAVHQASPYGVGGPSRPMSGGAPAQASFDNGGPLTPISELTPYSRRWKVKGRVISKTDIRMFRNGEGKLFSIEIVDGGGQIRAALFGSCVDKYFNVIREKGVYLFSGGTVKKANKAYNPNGEFEITFGEQTEIVDAPDDAAIPGLNVQYNFKQSLASLENDAPGSIVDVAAIIAELKQTVDINLKAGGTKPKRDIVLVDDSGASVQMTLWGNTIAQSDGMEGKVIFVKGAKVSDFGGRSLSNLSQTRMEFDGTGHERGNQLRAWYQAHGREPVRNALTGRGGGSGPRQTLEECKEEDKMLGIEDQNSMPDPNLKYIIHILAHDRPPYYLACPFEIAASEEGKQPRCCNKKVEQVNGQYMCAAGHSCQEPIARWMFSPTFGDETGSMIMRVFDEAGQSLMGCQANAIARIWEQKDTNADAADQIDNIFRAAQWKRWRLRVKSKREMWNDEDRINMQVMEATPIQISKEGMSMLENVFASVEPSAPAPRLGNA
eukprot:gnl/MRDRNA2_/MRDRNA2_58766_c0_seq1.p1 gnl/MRDRNA2_/MRDRNA2_58766_c0~~gnl/MRDRNA2_/MRDRNA2_58766_c0_seq1.p1  ORF type:complete len:580 (+),score=121.03 gnl/MRDRNA2_/MRDRNA2_58766_c0_seq1:88-1827(+)